MLKKENPDGWTGFPAPDPLIHQTIETAEQCGSPYGGDRNRMIHPDRFWISS
jgi:hypothetical protein